MVLLGSLRHTFELMSTSTHLPSICGQFIRYEAVAFTSVEDHKFIIPKYLLLSLLYIIFINFITN